MFPMQPAKTFLGLHIPLSGIHYSKAARKENFRVFIPVTDFDVFIIDDR